MSPGEYRRDCTSDCTCRQAEHCTTATSACTLQLTYRRLRANFDTGFEYNNRDECFFNDSHFSGLGKRSFCELRVRRAPADASLQPPHLSRMSDSLPVARLFDVTRLPNLRKDAKPANVAGADPGGRLFRVLLAVPVQSAWDSPWHDRTYLFWDHYRHRS